jgi:hypothetical protein
MNVIEHNETLDEDTAVVYSADLLSFDAPVVVKLERKRKVAYRLKYIQMGSATWLCNLIKVFLSQK